ncbi:MAG: hypothetical protein HN929_01940 [Chloroflexi bacterium]|mgnify:CR=1 FL=1|jgi:hypothetical protein|nr:hypothetical protein [Gammaproteobacteria bacterium]MBT7080221.1 hypothetical protein [Chloroflexota bacterium]
MATIVVEDGTGKTDSNSYISEADFSTYATDRGVTISGTVAVLLIQAMDYIEEQPFKGDKGSDDQALQWPRSGVIIDGYSVDTDAIPVKLTEALCEAAIAIDGGDNPLSGVGRDIKRTKAGSVEVEYMDGARSTTYLAALENKLSNLLNSGSRGISAEVIRA